MTDHRHRLPLGRANIHFAMLFCLVAGSTLLADDPAVEAVNFQSRLVYRAEREPHYAAWVSLFPGENGTWYIGCDEVSRTDPPLPQASPEAVYGMALPLGYDKSQYLMEAVLLESTDDLQSWRLVSREPYRHHHSVHQFGSARTRDGRFLRFNWACYDLDPRVKTNEILRISGDGGQTWDPAPPFVPDRFAYYPHRLRTLRDGTLVLCLPIGHRWGPDDDYPNRTAINLNTNNDLRMTLYFSFDDGRSWDGPLPILDGQNVSETDFIELPEGDLLLINNSIFSRPGRQFVYREGNNFVPGPLEFVRSGSVPETVCRSADGVLVGCMRPGSYAWSDDLGETWQPLTGVGGADEVYQPWIHALPDGRIICAGHKGYDDPIGVGRMGENTIHLHTFRLKVRQHTENTRLRITRDFDPVHRQWRNSYTLKLTQGDAPLAGKELEVWYVERYQPGYDSYNSLSLEKRMQAGGTVILATTDDSGVAHVQLPDRYTQTSDPHLSYQLVARFNADRGDPAYKPSQTPQLEYYARARMDDELK